MGWLAGVDLGGTNVVCGLVNSEGVVLRILKEPTESHRGSDAVIEKIARMIQRLLEAEHSSLQELDAVGIGLPGFLDPEAGVVLLASNLQWTNVPVASLLGKLLQTPVFIDNDVRMFTYGEATAGAAKGYEHVLGLTLGTGLASSMINKGRLYYGSGCRAGEIGHIPMEGIPYACGCGMTGCLETIASATGIATQAKALVIEGKSTHMAEWFANRDLNLLQAYDVSKAYDAGDPAAIEVMNYTGTKLGLALSFAVTLYGPDVIVFGGGASLAGERLFKPMREKLQSNVHPMYWERLTILTAQLLDEAGIIGSALYAMNQRQQEN